MIADDSGAARFWVFVPGSGLWLVPAGVDENAHAEALGATVLFHGTTKNRQPVARFERQPDGTSRTLHPAD